ncbi:23S rRNA (guanine(745)-N(1))-methyltransferase [Pseudoalteromonas spongiae]|uniref:23S rRNA (guanine(745)-N(1))-methyltransferase n=1 Tax=Pseudoalteromonas spongiae TaxID=298657 RepID=UPI00026CAEF9|nr:23S rRNA (guanine(745)-N(1))-methyltransferase [Pseudoalteromonas spongiae]ATC98499.1 23S rRNA (guanine745-N1)-methyltransferase [Pseudoalteromonas spongiae UST010723-006]
MSQLYFCPMCQTPLADDTHRLICANNHSFDKAKEGYINLLPVQNKKSKDPGDNKEMVMARRAFLARGHYNFLRDAICQQIEALENNSTLLDVGCGEGFYTHKFDECENVATTYGLDISKPAVKYAAKRFKNCHFSVASSSNAPFNDAAFDIVTSVFSPLFSDELNRLVNDNGALIVASPGDNHLTELKSIIYNEVRPHQPVEAPTGFSLQSHTLHTEVVSLELDALTELIKMTPFAWKFRPEHWHSLSEKTPFTVTLSFYVSVFNKGNA